MFSFLRALLVFSGAALAAGFYGNQSYIDWKTAGTDHFQFIYPAEYSDHAMPKRYTILSSPATTSPYPALVLS